MKIVTKLALVVAVVLGVMALFKGPEIYANMTCGGDVVHRPETGEHFYRAPGSDDYLPITKDEAEDVDSLCR